MEREQIIRMAREAGIVMSLVRPCHPRKGASMTRDDIITAASKAGFETKRDMILVDTWEITPTLTRFAALVAAQEREACKQWFIEDSERFAGLVAAAEREACAKVCDARYMGDNNREDMEARRCAAAIRARGQE
jgi:hypothetical protein